MFYNPCNVSGSIKIKIETIGPSRCSPRFDSGPQKTYSDGKAGAKTDKYHALLVDISPFSGRQGPQNYI